MDNLGHAQKMMALVSAALNDVEPPIDVELALQIAQACVAMAQAEQLKRIADSMNTKLHEQTFGVADLLRFVSQDITDSAEQLKRIADMMEGYLAIHADPAVLSTAKELASN